MRGPKRERNWAKDPKIDIRYTFTPPDYKGMSQEPYFFDRGHQAPLASFKNHPKWYVLNYLSNITPQKKDLNRGPLERPGISRKEARWSLRDCLRLDRPLL